MAEVDVSIDKTSSDIADRMVECRDSALAILGRGYLAKMAEVGGFIQKEADDRGCNVAGAAIALAEEAESDMAALLILAAAVEMLDPFLDDDDAKEMERKVSSLYQCRVAARAMLGDEYSARMAEYGAVIQEAAGRNNVGLVAAAEGVAAEQDSEMLAMLILAAAVELIEPSTDG